ncbi:MAG: adenylate/guanylate cyclase domain-containing protein [Polyangiaceae bacterium]|nr:adenylate/guanylate cyclase domain-containing protein [Polyangiaceae bacterium]
MRTWLSSLLRLGLDERLPAREAKNVVLTNAITLIAAAHLVPLAGFAIVAGLRGVVHWILACCLAYLSVLGVAASGRVLAARAWLAAVSAAAIVGASLLLGPEMRAEAYLFVAVTATWYVWADARHAILVTLLFMASYVVLLALYAKVGAVDPPPAALAGLLKVALFAGVMLALLAFVAWSHRQTKLLDLKLDAEHERSERLLRNVLPDRIAERLKDGPVVVADRFEGVTVLFADLVGFTPLSTTLAPERVVDLLNRVFTCFDELAARHGVEKIKTIGDAYMAVAGLPEPRADHAEAAAQMALDLRATTAELSRAMGHPLQIRIGLCSGPAVAGVIGIRKFAYDLWGDTVNTAARMESHGAPGEIQVTESTYRLLSHRYAFDDRGVIDVKGKGPMRTYFLQGAA